MKTRDVIRERRGRTPQTKLQTPDLSDAVLDALNARIASSTYLTMAEAAVYLRYQGPHAPDVARQFCRRMGIRLHRRGGGCLLVKRVALDRFLDTGSNHAPSVRQVSKATHGNSFASTCAAAAVAASESN